MVVAVTGGTGFIGRHLVASLAKDGVQVRALTRRPEVVPRLWPTGDVEPWEGDLTRPETLRGFVRRARVVYHLAGEVRDVNAFNRVNVTGTENLLEVCRDEPPKRFVHLSSTGVIGASGAGVVDESTPCQPMNAYEKSKYASERMVFVASKKFQIPVTVIRPTIVFGEDPNQDSDSLGSWLNAIQKGWFRFFGTSDSVANYIYVGDVVRACLLVAESERATAEVYVVSDSCPLRDFVGAAAEFLGVRMPGTLPISLGYAAAVASEMAGRLAHFPPPLTVSRFKALTNRVVYSSDRFRKELGFSPAFGWREGLRRTVEWYEENKRLASTGSN